MTTESLAAAVLSDIVETGTEDYKTSIESTDINDVVDPYWASLFNLYNRLSVGDRSTLIAIIRQSQIDALATMFAAIDGITSLRGQNEDMHLVSQGGNKLSGGLSDEFLRLVEEGSKS